MSVIEKVLIEPFWSWILADDDRAYFCSHMLFAAVWGAGIFILICFYFSLFYDLARYAPTKIQKDIWPSVSDMAAAAVPQILIYVIANWVSWLMFDIRWELPQQPPTFLEICRDLTLNFLLGDFLIYWEHRIQHAIPWLRHNIHCVHHKYTTVFSWAGGWVHPIEDLFVVATQTVGPLWLVPCHPLSFWIFVTLWVIFLVEEHSGHDVWWSPHKLIPFSMGGGAAPHDIHHSPLTTKNFGFVFCIWDQIFGTFEPPPGEEHSVPKKSKADIIVRCILVLAVAGLLVLVCKDPILEQMLGYLLIPAAILSLGYVEGLYEFIGGFFTVWIGLMKFSAELSFVVLFLIMGVCAGCLCNRRCLFNMFFDYDVENQPKNRKNPLQAVGIEVSDSLVRGMNWLASEAFLITLLRFVFSKPRIGDRPTKFYDYLGFMRKHHVDSPWLVTVSFGCFFYLCTYFMLTMVYDQHLEHPQKNADQLFSSLKDVFLVYIPALAFLMMCLESFILVPLFGLLINVMATYIYVQRIALVPISETRKVISTKDDRN